MGLASAMSTALTGLTAAETTIDVVGNNLANANTVGFKASTANFATQFLQTRSLGSAPTSDSGGTNPRQAGLGTLVAEISPNFTQGTIEISSTPTDMAIQGDGFFIVEGAQGERFYTRNGIFKLNAENELTTMTGNRLLGHGVDDQFQIQSTDLVPLEIPLGAAAVAKPTEHVYLEGTLSPTGDLGDTAAVIQTGVLSDEQWDWPATKPDVNSAEVPANNLNLANGGAGTIAAGTYYYKYVYADGPLGGTPATEGMVSADPPQSILLGGASQVNITNWDAPTDDYGYVRVYRSTLAGGVNGDYYLVDEAPIGGGPINDDYSDAVISSDPVNHPMLDQSDVLNGSYQYYVTFYHPGDGRESRPSPVSDTMILGSNGRVHLENLPADASGYYTQTKIYRNSSTDPDRFYEVVTLPGAAGTATYTDSMSDATLVTQPELNVEGPPIRADTLLIDVISREGSSYTNVFELGTLQFTGRKGGRSLAMKEFEIESTSTVLDLINFMENAMGIQEVPGPDPTNPIQPSQGVYGGNPGGSVTTGPPSGLGHILFRGNNGEDCAIDIGLSGMKLIRPDGSEANIDLPFTQVQEAKGESAVADFIVYDTLGIPISVRLTAVLEERTSTATTYRWYADSPDNDPASGVEIDVGTGLITFDGEGNFTTASESTISIQRHNVSSASPLEFELDFGQLSGLATENSTLAVSRQDGSAPGVLTSFIVGEDGKIRGVFSNGITRDLGQIRLSRFSNPAGLEQKGENMFATGVNSGLPVEGNPNEQGIGSIIAGAQELSNTDIGGNLIDLILASTMYRGNTRVITTSQEMFDELLALHR